MKTFYCTFGLGSPLKNLLLRVQSESASAVRKEMLAKAGGCFCEAYAWDKETAAAKVEKYGWTIVDGGIIE